MAKLTTKARKALPKKDFAGPGRSYPIPNKAHARLAKAMASKEVDAGRLSRAAERKIDRKANRKLGKSGSARKTN